MIKLRPEIRGDKDSFREIEFDGEVIGSQYTYIDNNNEYTLYQCLVPVLEFYKKKYKYYGEDNGYMFIYFDTLKELLQFKRINYDL